MVKTFLTLLLLPVFAWAVPDGWIATDGSSTVSLTSTNNSQYGSVIHVAGLSYPAVYTLWPYEVSGETTNYGKAFQINKANVFHCYPYIASTNEQVDITGLALSLTNTVATKLYCEETASWIDVDEANFYRARFTVPSWTNGTYTLRAHNGYGNKYGISDESVTLTITNAPDYSTATNTVATTAWADVQAAKALLDSGETLYFPAGTYEFDGEIDNLPDNVHIMGAGAGLTIIKPSASYTPGIAKKYLIDVISGVTTYYSDNSKISGITFDAGDSDLDLDGLLGFRGNRITVDGCDFTMTNAIALGDTFQFNGNGIAAFIPNALDGKGPVTVKNCNFWYSDRIVVGNESIYMNNTSYGHNEPVTGGAIAAQGSGLFISNNFYQADSSTTNKSYWCKGRAITYDGNAGSSMDVYIEGNIAVDFDQPENSGDGNSGEDVLFEGVHGWLYEPVASATSNSVTLDALNTNNTMYVYLVNRSLGERVDTNTLSSFSSGTATIDGTWAASITNSSTYVQIPAYSVCNYAIGSTSNTVSIYGGNFRTLTDEMITVTSGTGFGQSRRIVSKDANTGIITVAPEWRIVPDTNSYVSVSTAPRRAVVFNNNFKGLRASVTNNHNTAGCLVSFYGGSSECYVDSNISQYTEEGVAFRAYPYTFCASVPTVFSAPTYFNVARNNSLSDYREYGLKTAVYISSFPATEQTAIFGLGYLNNTISNALIEASTIVTPIEQITTDTVVLWGNVTNATSGSSIGTYTTNIVESWE